jgi:hypothetical protein
MVMILMSCNAGSINTSKTQEEKTTETWEAIEKNLASGAEVSRERPFPQVLSEQEILLKAFEYAHKIGALHPSYSIYQENPALLTAKIETPVLIYHIPTGSTNTYSLIAVDNDGTTLIDSYVRSSVDADIDSFEVVRITGIVNVPKYSVHHITKREAMSLMKSQFPDKQISEPIAIAGIYLEDSRYSNNQEFWYFTVGDNNRGAAEDAEEYIIDSEIGGWKTIAGGMANRAAISSGDGGSPYFNGNRMARLETPLRIHERIEAARSAGGATSFTANSVENVQYTPIPLR